MISNCTVHLSLNRGKQVETQFWQGRVLVDSKTHQFQQDSMINSEFGYTPLGRVVSQFGAATWTAGENDGEEIA